MFECVYAWVKITQTIRQSSNQTINNYTNNQAISNDRYGIIIFFYSLMIFVVMFCPSDLMCRKYIWLGRSDRSIFIDSPSVLAELHVRPWMSCSMMVLDPLGRLLIVKWSVTGLGWTTTLSPVAGLMLCHWYWTIQVSSGCVKTFLLWNTLWLSL